MTILESLSYMFSQTPFTAAIYLAAEFAFLLWLVTLPFVLHDYKKETNRKLDQLQSELAETKVLFQKLMDVHQDATKDDDNREVVKDLDNK